jgi:hypothetical protein
MSELDALTLIIVAFGIYYVINIKKAYKEYQKTKGMLDFNMLVRDIGVIFAGIVLILYL